MKVEYRGNEENDGYLKVGTNDGYEPRYRSVFCIRRESVGRKVCR